MSPEQLRALRQPALSPDASGAARDPDLEGEGWARGELKALRTAGAKSRPRVRANLLRGRAARAAAEQARQEAEAGGASLEEVADAVRQAAGRVMSRPLEEFMLAPEPDQGSPLTECL